jgi:hypothetical protein
MTAAEALAGSHDCCDGPRAESLRIDSLPCPQRQHFFMPVAHEMSVPIPLGHEEGRALCILPVSIVTSYDFPRLN